MLTKKFAVAILVIVSCLWIASILTYREVHRFEYNVLRQGQRIDRYRGETCVYKLHSVDEPIAGASDHAYDWDPRQDSIDNARRQRQEELLEDLPQMDSEERRYAEFKLRLLEDSERDRQAGYPARKVSEWTWVNVYTGSPCSKQ